MRRRSILGWAPAALVGLALQAGVAASPAPAGSGPPGRGGGAPSTRDRVVNVRRVASSSQLKGAPAVEIEVTSPRAFPVMGSPPIMRIGRREILVSRYPPDGDLHTLIFSLTPEEFEATKEGEPVVVQYGRGGAKAAPPGRPDLVWSFGSLRKPPR